MKKILIALIVAALIAIGGHLTYLFSLKPTERYPQDSFLRTTNEKRALVIVAHDDDAISCAGTISQLAAQGWAIDYITFYGKWHGEINPIRKKEMEAACKIQGIRSAKYFDFPLQRTDTVKMPWMPIPYNKFNDFFPMDSIKQIVRSVIVQHKPSVIFASDDVIGGYGHPEHVAVGRCVVVACSELRKEGIHTVEKIYQPVFTPTQAENTIGGIPAFQAGKKIYQCDGMPTPSVQIDITSAIDQKKTVMTTYKTQQGPIKKVWPYYNWYPGWIYFSVFDREFFHVIDTAEI